MNETLRDTWLRLFLRVLSVGFPRGVHTQITLIPVNAAAALASLLRFQPYNAH